VKTPRRSRLILPIILLVLVLIQFLPVDRSVPAVDPVQDFVAVTNPPAALGALIKDACYDCHSYETEYPWYAYISPVAQWLQRHINHGREHMNLSIWTTYTPGDTDHALEEMVEMVESKNMPLKSFTWVHSEARLTDTQRVELAAWFESLRDEGVRQEGGDEHEE
jgi:hypothetical protein